MAENNIILCNGCMSPLDGDNPCGCGYKNTPNKQYHLGCDTLLRGNFLIGRVVLLEGESTVYIGYDREKGEKIFIQEYFPYPISKRHENRETVIPVQGCEVQYKTLMADFEELARLEIKLSEEYNILAPYAILGDNNTVYCIYEYSDYTTLEQYIDKRGTTLVWADMKGAFLQLCNGVAAIHKNGLIHRGISGETILVDKTGCIYLTRLSTAPNRTAQSELRPTLFMGYSAPEQYNPTMWQGNWTDIYSLCALLYKCLTGERVKKDNKGYVIPPIDLNSSIPQYVSDTICNGLVENNSFRISDISRLTALLLEDTSSNTAVFSTEKVQEWKPKEIPSPKDIKHTIHGGTTIIHDVEKALKKEQNKNKIKGIKHLIIGVGIIVLILTVFVSYSRKANNNLDEEPQESSSNPIITLEMPNFVGKRADDITKDEKHLKDFNFIVKEEFSDDVKYGDIISQEPESGEKYVNKPNVILTVSMGMRSVKMPDILGHNITEAMNRLDALGLKYEVFEVVDDHLTVGIVGRCNFSTGDAVDVYDDVVYIYTGSSATNSSQSSKEPNN